MSAQILHGGGIDRAIASYGGERADWLDLSTGINPVPWPLPPIELSAWHDLPDRRAETALYEAARSAYGLSGDYGIAAANGTQALIEILPRILPCDRVSISSPTYQEHALSWTKAGRHVELIASGGGLSRFSNAMVVVNPNNPDGCTRSSAELMAIAGEAALRHGWLIVDEAFADCRPEQSIVPLLGRPGTQENIIVLRSFGKFYGLAGMRLGFAIGPHSITNQLLHMLGPWAVSGPALAVGAAALNDHRWAKEARQRLINSSARLNELLLQQGFEIVGGTPLFTLVSHQRAKDIHHDLCGEHILTRRFSDQPSWLRFGLCANHDELQRLRAALEKLMS